MLQQCNICLREEKSFVNNYVMKRKQCTHTAAAARSSKITSYDFFPKEILVEMSSSTRVDTHDVPQ
jgi:hypothetical protein